MNEIFFTYFDSPIGLIELISTENSLIKCNFLKKEQKPQSEKLPLILKEALQQLDEYFKGKRLKFELKFDLVGTDFQKKVWKELQRIPFGQTITYKKLAEKTGNKMAARAVGNANAKNPISIIIPCHRVIGSKGDLRNYGGGIDRKKWLIDFEKMTELQN
ncbi:MAG: methylated-DNA--[protein]-cysteine S-methyltransferase [Asgard group archaeon]|nr:methylated-DNA--[protein]-cysteine S-methyltransferase [Asgard group archaeon]